MAKIIEVDDGESDNEDEFRNSLEKITKAINPTQEASKVRGALVQSMKAFRASEIISKSPAVKMTNSAHFIGSQKLNMGMVDLFDSLRQQQEMFRSPLQDTFDSINKVNAQFALANPLTALSSNLGQYGGYDKLIDIATYKNNAFGFDWLDKVLVSNSAHARLFENLNNLDFGKRFGIPELPSQKLRKSFELLEKSYLNYGLGLEQESADEQILVAESEFTTENIIHLIQDEQDELEEAATKVKEFALITRDQFSSKLAAYNPDLLESYNGAIYVLHSMGPDASRHYSSSARKILDELMNQLAPRKDVEHWALKNGKLPSNKRIKKSLLFEYVLQDIESKNLRQVFEADIIANSKFLECLNDMVHGTKRELSEFDRMALHNKMEYLALLLLNIHFSKRDTN